MYPGIMKPVIALLSDRVINQIKAGEVIENPASVVKELVDNAIDAGAKKIAIEIQAGGQQLILVDDDGCGMSREDVALCLLRHATSKISQVEDLDSLDTMGFRGEALAAIASISKLEIRTSNGHEATLLAAVGGQIESVLPCARNCGTSVEVRSLFFNAPARRKFQKSAQANSAQIVKIVQSLALSHPEIAFSLCSQGQMLFDLNPTSWKERVQELMGPECEAGLFIEGEGIFGFLGPSEEARSTRQRQHFFLNRRPIFSPILAKAVSEGYGTRLSTGQHPTLVLFLERPAHEFDVNVHPQKKEVRFRDESEIFRSMKEVIFSAFLPQKIVSDSPIRFEPPSLPFSLREASESPPPDPWMLKEGPVLKEPPLLFQKAKGRALAMVGAFLIAEKERKVVLVDLRQEMSSWAKTKERQTLLLAIEVEMSLEEEQEVEKILQRCCDAGIEARAIGRRRLCLDAIPSWLDPSEAVAFFETLRAEEEVESILSRYLKMHPPKINIHEAEWLWQQSTTLREVEIFAGDLEKILGKHS